MKVIANIQKIVKPEIICSNQKIFIQNRSIQDDIVLTHATIRGFSLNAMARKAFLKVDLRRLLIVSAETSLSNIESYRTIHRKDKEMYH